jgi:hypothetical protein
MGDGTPAVESGALTDGASDVRIGSEGTGIFDVPGIGAGGAEGAAG